MTKVTVEDLYRPYKQKIRMISTSEIRVTVIVDRADMVKAMNAAHEAFEL